MATRDIRGFDTLVLLTAWSIWKQRNARAFNNLNQQWSTHQPLVERIKEEFKLNRLRALGGCFGGCQRICSHMVLAFL
jgi:hypothetical protein